MGAIHVDNQRCKENLDLNAMATHGKGSGGFDILSPFVSRWKYRYIGSQKSSFDVWDDPNADKRPSKWEMLKNKSGHIKLIAQTS